jgi:hypothetical protein
LPPVSDRQQQVLPLAAAEGGQAVLAATASVPLQRQCAAPPGGLMGTWGGAAQATHFIAAAGSTGSHAFRSNRPRRRLKTLPDVHIIKKTASPLPAILG